MSTVLIDYPAPHVARIRINRPEKRNALDHNTRQLLIEGLQTIFSDKNNRALVFGGVEGILSAGGDIGSMANLTEQQARERMRHGRLLSRTFAEAQIPVVTAIEGMGVGNSVGLAMLGDYIVMGDDAFVMFPFLKIGLVPDWGILRSLPRRVGFTFAKRVLMTCEKIPANKAEMTGLVDEVVAKDSVMETAIEKASQLSKLPIAALGLMKARLNIIASTLDEELASDEETQSKCLLHAEFAEGYDAFVQKRNANFTNLKVD
ncbi:enoyl-CoA hydratase/isomerase family protein [Alteromonas sp. M12]|uniref:enoyl-CoA hydratase/isomerase family protein n=1 Tax=Alteromonas sp. M12 TaxID=3135644 RepID=UPI00319E8F1A